MHHSISDRVLEVLEWPAVAAALKSRCSSEPGKKHITNLKPLTPSESSVRMSKISALKEISALHESVPLAGISAIQPLADRASKGSSLTLEELIQIRDFVAGTRRIRHFLSEFVDEYEPLRDEYENLDPLDRLHSALIPAINDNGELSDQRYPRLRKLKQQAAAARSDIEKKLTSMINSPALEKVLQEKIITSVNQRYVLLVKSGMKGRMNGTVQDVSASGATLYYEPDEVKALNNSIIMLEMEYQNEVLLILRELSAVTGEHSPALRQNLEIASYIDFLNACARFSAATGASAPKIAGDRRISLKNAKHPLLCLQNPKETVGNNISLGEDFNCLIISGANTGGKTVLLKTIGLAVLFALTGLHVTCGPDSEIGIFDGILADIGDDQSLQMSLSTFSGQIVIIGEMLRKATPRTLILIDEIIVGTNPRQGAALAQSILEHLAATDSLVVATTHYTELKELASSESGRFRNASVSFDLETLRPAYRLVMGLPGVSYAVEIARNYGLPETVLKRAIELTDSRDLSVEALLEETQRFRSRMEEESSRIEELKKHYRAEKMRLEEEQRRLAQLTLKVKNKEGIDFLEELEKYRGKVAAKIAELQQADLKDAGSLQKELIEIESEISSRLQKQQRESAESQYRRLTPEETTPGKRVYVLQLEKDGVIEDVDSSGKTAQILFGGSIRARFKTDELYYIPDRAGSSASAPRPIPRVQVTSSIGTTVQTSYNTIDLRGCRVDEALNKMEAGLDRMTGEGISTAIVIHGHGTGALKQAVRDNLKTSTYAADFRSGETGEGGDGVTVVRIRNV